MDTTNGGHRMSLGGIKSSKRNAVINIKQRTKNKGDLMCKNHPSHAGFRPNPLSVVSVAFVVADTRNWLLGVTVRLYSGNLRKYILLLVWCGYFHPLSLTLFIYPLSKVW